MSDSRRDPPESNGSLLQAAPGVVRIAVGASWRTTTWTLGLYVRAGSRVVRAAASGESAAQLLQDIGNEVRDQARRVLGVIDSSDSSDSSDNGAAPGWPARSSAQRHAPPEGGGSLRDRGAELLRQSADVRYEEPAHPAYARILGELAPDEARILRMLVLEGPQPAVDVRASKALIAGSQLVAPGLSVIGAQAGARYLDRVPAYLNNLYRLGLIWFSREALEDPIRYQVLEAQPDVLDALKSGGRSRTVRRSIHLTPFGEDFCKVCLPLQTAEIDALGDPQDEMEAVTGAGSAPGRPT